MRVRAGDWLVFTSAERMAILLNAAAKNMLRWAKRKAALAEATQ